MGWTAQRGNKWRAFYRHDGKIVAAGTWPSKGRAQLAADSAEREAHAGVTRAPTWGEWQEVWMQRRVVSEGTLRSDAEMIRLRMLAKWGDFLLGDITTPLVADWLSELKQDGLSTGSVRKYVYCLSGSMTAAVAAGLVAVNPVRGVKFPQTDPMPDRFLHDGELAALRDTMDPEYQFFFDLSLGTGLRWGEATALHWEDVDLGVAPQITVRWSWSRQMRYFKAPKTHQVRIVPLGDALVNVLRDRLTANGYGTPKASSLYRGSRVPHSGLVYGPVDEKGWQSEWRAAVKFGRVDGRRVGHCRPSDLRHTFASRHLRSGVPIDVVQMWLGHSSVSTTERYAKRNNDFSQWRHLL